MSRKHPTPESFEYALGGIKTAIKNEPNFKFQLLVAFLTLALGYYLQLSTTEFAILILIICIVLVLELINTALEALVDISSPDIHPKAKIAKDVAAASVLVAALASVFVGVLLFLPKIL
jgi:diacylglycerol kinase